MNESATSRAWAQYRRLLKIMGGVTLAAIVAALAWLHARDTPMPFAFIIAVVVAIAGSLMLSAALMGLVFFSNASGADDDVAPADDPPDRL